MEDLATEVRRLVGCAAKGDNPDAIARAFIAAAREGWPAALDERDALRAEVARLRGALEGVLPYTEAERLAEAAALRTGQVRAPIRQALARARAELDRP